MSTFYKLIVKNKGISSALNRILQVRFYNLNKLFCFLDHNKQFSLIKFDEVCIISFLS